MSRIVLPPYLTLLLLVTACGSLQERTDMAASLAADHGFQKSIVSGDNFELLTYHRIRDDGGTVTIHIEGDGYAFIDQNRVSPNPTPKNPLGLKLAIRDQTDNVIYIAQPCQYVPISTQANCGPEYWTLKRYAPEVVAVFQQVIDDFKKEKGFEKIRLVGYSGGAAIAAIVAAQREDVLDLRTIAGNLDIDAFAREHGVTLLTGSLNPASFAKALAGIPQRHLLGRDDEVITKAVIDSYVNAIAKHDPRHRCIGVEYYSGVSHAKCWDRLWLAEQQRVALCRK